jgi:protein SCO1/2
MTRRLLAVGALSLVLAGCGAGPSWQTKDISGFMPSLGFTLTSEDGTTVTQQQYAGKINLLFFGYTHCPDTCPITLARLRKVIHGLPPDVAKQVQVLFVSVDPKRDSPGVLRTYTAAFGEMFIGLTGTKAQLDALTRRYRTTYGYGEPDANGNYEVTHGSAVYAFDAAGKVRLLIRSSDSDEAVAHDITRLVRS